MSARPIRVMGARWTNWYRRAFPAYLIFLFSTTHFPNLRLPEKAGDDKLAHMVAFGLLAFLFWRFLVTFVTPHTWRFAGGVALATIAYAAFDEITQPIFRRSSDVSDWVADTCGIVVVIVALEVVRRFQKTDVYR